MRKKKAHPTATGDFGKWNDRFVQDAQRRAAAIAAASAATTAPLVEDEAGAGGADAQVGGKAVDGATAAAVPPVVQHQAEAPMAAPSLSPPSPPRKKSRTSKSQQWREHQHASSSTTTTTATASAGAATSSEAAAPTATSAQQQEQQEHSQRQPSASPSSAGNRSKSAKRPRGGEQVQEGNDDHVVDPNDVVDGDADVGSTTTAATTADDGDRETSPAAAMTAAAAAMHALSGATMGNAVANDVLPAAEMLLSGNQESVVAIDVTILGTYSLVQHGDSHFTTACEKFSQRHQGAAATTTMPVEFSLYAPSSGKVYVGRSSSIPVVPFLIALLNSPHVKKYVANLKALSTLLLHHAGSARLLPHSVVDVGVALAAHQAVKPSLSASSSSRGGNSGGGGGSLSSSSFAAIRKRMLDEQEKHGGGEQEVKKEQHREEEQGEDLAPAAQVFEVTRYIEDQLSVAYHETLAAVERDSQVQFLCALMSYHGVLVDRKRLAAYTRAVLEKGMALEDQMRTIMADARTAIAARRQLAPSSDGGASPAKKSQKSTSKRAGSKQKKASASPAEEIESEQPQLSSSSGAGPQEGEEQLALLAKAQAVLSGREGNDGSVVEASSSPAGTQQQQGGGVGGEAQPAAQSSAAAAASGQGTNKQKKAAVLLEVPQTEDGVRAIVKYGLMFAPGMCGELREQPPRKEKTTEQQQQPAEGGEQQQHGGGGAGVEDVLVMSMKDLAAHVPFVAHYLELQRLRLRQAQLKKIDQHCCADGKVQQRHQEEAPATANSTLVGSVQMVLHPDFHADSSTGRIFTSKPNVQTLPKAAGNTTEGTSDDSTTTASVRKLLVAPPGCTLLSFDYSQIELRVAAHMAEDRQMAAFFAADGGRGDILTSIGQMIFHPPPIAIAAGVGVGEGSSQKKKSTSSSSAATTASAAVLTPEQRDATKRVVYGMLYGRQDNQIQSEIDPSTGIKASEVRTKFCHICPSLHNFLHDVKDAACHVRLVRSMGGRVRSLLHEQDEWKVERQAVSMVIQGSAADLLKEAMIDIAAIHHNFYNEHSQGQQEEQEAVAQPPPPFALCLSMHDELLFVVPDSCVHAAAALIKNTMEAQGAKKFGMSFVPLRVSVKAGKDFGSLAPLAPPSAPSSATQ